MRGATQGDFDAPAAWSRADILADLIEESALGLCVFDVAGQIVASDGISAQIGLRIGEAFESWPAFVGLGDAILSLRQTGAALELFGIGTPALNTEKYDIRISWRPRHAMFVALFLSAAARAQLEVKSAQVTRENRILLERIEQQQKQIEVQNAMMQSFITHVPAAVAMLDDKMNYVMVSQRWLDELAAGEVNLAGKPFGEGVPGAAKRWEQALRRTDRVASAGIEKINTKVPGPMWQKWQGQRVAGLDSDRPNTLIFAENITKTMQQTTRLRVQARQLERLNGELRSFALAASHDLRAPLRQIQSFVTFLQADDAARFDQDGADYIALIEQCSSRMAGMLDALLRYAKINYDENIAEVFEVSEAVQAACANLDREIKQRKGDVRCVSSAIMRGDLALMTILFQNLIDNGLKYSHRAAPQIQIGVERASDGTLMVSILDDGPGIAAGVQTKAFDLFQRLGAPATSPGSGVGMTTCRKIAMLHGGALVIDPDYRDGLKLALRLPGVALS